MTRPRLAAAIAVACFISGCAQTQPGFDAERYAGANLSDGNGRHNLDALWQRLRSGLSFSDTAHPDVQRQLGQLRARHVDAVSERAAPFLDLVLDEAQSRGMPAEVALLPMLESGYRPQAVSPGKAAGLWQIMPGTADHLGLRRSAGYDGRRDVKASTEAALDYLQALNRTFEGDWLLTLAAYNSGPRTVQRAVEANRRQGKSTAFWDLELPRVTQEYVPRLLALSKIIAEPDAFGVKLASQGEVAELTSVEIGPQVDLSFAAAAAGLSSERFYAFNAGLTPGTRQLDQPLALLLPRDNARALQQKLGRLPATRSARWVSYRMHADDTPESLAERFDTSATALVAVNRQAGNELDAGQEVLVPVDGKAVASSSGATANRAHDADILATDQPLRERISRLMTVSYPVQPGDSLAALSEQFRVQVDDLRRWNGLSESTSAEQPLEAGRTMLVYLDALAGAPQG